MKRIALLLIGALWTTTATAQEFSVQFRGRAELTGFVPSKSPAWLIRETDPFLAGRLSGFAEAFAGDHIYAFGELRADQGEAPTRDDFELRIEQLFLRLTPTDRIDLNLQAGKFISPFGNYPGRSHTSADPFIRPPVNYDFRTVVSTRHVPRATAGFLTWKDDDAAFRPVGAPIVWATPYQVGFMAFGSISKLAYRAAVMNSAPSSEPARWDPWFDEAAGPSYVGHAAIQLIPELRIGASYNRGPYLDPAVEDSLGSSIDDFNQEIIGFEFTATRGLAELRGELLLDRWEVPNLADDPREISYYAELKYKLLPGLAAAARVGRIDFNEIDAGSTYTEWDYDVIRWQLAALYTVSEKLELRGELMLNRARLNARLFSIQVGYSF